MDVTVVSVPYQSQVFVIEYPHVIPVKTGIHAPSILSFTGIIKIDTRLRGYDKNFKYSIK